MEQVQLLKTQAADSSKTHMQIVRLITKKEYDLN